MRTPRSEKERPAERLYEFLLRAYPARFRAEYGAWMQQAFRDLAREKKRGDGFWWFILRDWGGSMMRSWRGERPEQSGLWVALAAAALLPSAAFFSTVILIEALGVQAAAPLQRAMLGPGGTPRRHLADAIIVFSPLVALAMAAFPWLRGGRLFSHGGRAALAQSHAGHLSLLILGLSAVLGLVFLTYFLTENWQCLVGAAAVC